MAYGNKNMILSSSGSSQINLVLFHYGLPTIALDQSIYILLCSQLQKAEKNLICPGLARNGLPMYVPNTKCSDVNRLQDIKLDLGAIANVTIPMVGLMSQRQYANSSDYCEI